MIDRGLKQIFVEKLDAFPLVAAINVTVPNDKLTFSSLFATALEFFKVLSTVGVLTSAQGMLLYLDRVHHCRIRLVTYRDFNISEYIATYDWGVLCEGTTILLGELSFAFAR